MSENLWKYFLEDDVDSFVAVLRAQKSRSTAPTIKYDGRAGARGEPSSPNDSSRSKPNFDARQSLARQLDKEVTDAPLSKTEVNRRDSKGLTLLHHAASATQKSANEFAFALLAHPLIDLYIQDQENGWTALHRAFYFGNITIARAIVDRETQHHGGRLSGAGMSAPMSLMKIKDWERLGPYDLLAATIVDRTNPPDDQSESSSGGDDDNDNEERSPSREIEEDGSISTTIRPLVNIGGDELFTFGSNKNLTLGFGDEDDRQYPEAINLKRPQHLFKRFCREHFERRISEAAKANIAYANRLRDQLVVPEDASELPSVVRSTPIIIQDVQMSKFHSAILTSDPVSNLYICGHGLGGRLGTGQEKTQFKFVCVEDFGSVRKRIVSIALGQDHTLAVTSSGEIFTWGSNIHGQLGCGLPKETTKPEECIQLLPKQLFGPLKREVIIGVAASNIHSVAYTSTSLFTFGKNEGQLGLVDSQAANLKVQSIPRQVQASRISSSIQGVSAIDRATVCLLENHEVHVFANYGAVRLAFPFSSFSNYFLGHGSQPSRQARLGPKITKITSGGDTICALSSDGEVFTVTVSQMIDPEATSNGSSTTNPNKIRAALSTPQRAWSLKSDRMLARDIGVDADGSVILCTASGGVFRRIRRVRAAEGGANKSSGSKAKTYKFTRVPNLTRVVAVRASGSGAYAAIRQDCNVTRGDIYNPNPSLRTDMFALLAFKHLSTDSDIANPVPSFWQRPKELTKLTARLSKTGFVDDELQAALKRATTGAGHDMALATSASTLRIPVHSFLLSGRSPPIRTALRRYQQSGSLVTDAFSITCYEGTTTVLTFNGLDTLTIVELVLYMYTDTLIGFWQYTRRSPELAFRHRKVRAELIKVGLFFELPSLESTARRQVTHAIPSLRHDLELALLDSTYLSDGDTLVRLADGEMLVHSALMAIRCPFFRGLFQGRAEGLWLSGRRDERNGAADPVEVDLTNMELHVFKLVLRYLYTDSGEELFDTAVTASLDDFLDLVMEVLSAANELMLDDLSCVCQTILGRHVTSRNVCQLLNAVAPSSETTFKTYGLEYVSLSLEALLCNHWLDELDDDLMEELDQVVRDNQECGLPFAKSAEAEMRLHEKYPELAGLIERGRRAKIDALVFQSKHVDALTPLSRSRPSPSLRGKTPASMSPPSLPARYRAGPSEELAPPMPRMDLLPDPAQTFTSPSKTAQESVQMEPECGDAQSRPWGSSPVASTKLGMKDIMDQASSSRTSNIALGLQFQAEGTAHNVKSSSSRMSQREHKRQLQQQGEPATPAIKSSNSPASSPILSSPWKTIEPSKMSSTVDHDSNAQATPDRTSSPVARPPSTPQLTMRQTVANAPAQKGKTPLLPPATPPQPQQQIRRTSTTPATASPPPRESPTPSSSTSTIPIQSIRHQIRPDASPGFYMHQSLADIISKEEADKASIQDAVAKRSLQEIQEEQAFQEWWDQESKAVQEAASAPSASSSKGRGGRISGRGRRKGKEREGGRDKSRGASAK